VELDQGRPSVMWWMMSGPMDSVVLAAAAVVKSMAQVSRWAMVPDPDPKPESLGEGALLGQGQPEFTPQIDGDEGQGEGHRMEPSGAGGDGHADPDERHSRHHAEHLDAPEHASRVPGPSVRRRRSRPPSPGPGRRRRRHLPGPSGRLPPPAPARRPSLRPGWRRSPASTGWVRAGSDCPCHVLRPLSLPAPARKRRFPAASPGSGRARHGRRRASRTRLAAEHDLAQLVETHHRPRSKPPSRHHGRDPSQRSSRYPTSASPRSPPVRCRPLPCKAPPG